MAYLHVDLHRLKDKVNPQLLVKALKAAKTMMMKNTMTKKTMAQKKTKPE